MSIFKKYNIDHVDQKIFLNELYFPNGKINVKTYTKNMEKILMEWLRNIISVNNNYLFFDKDVLYKGKKQERKEPFNNDIDVLEYEDEDEVDEVIDKEILFLIDQILKCTKEIIHKKIASHKNFVYLPVLQCMGTSAFILSIKVYLAYDWDNVNEIVIKEKPKICQRVKNIINNVYNFFTRQKQVEAEGYNYVSSKFKTLSILTDDACSKNILLDMEEDLLKSSDWIPCIKTQYKSENLPNTQIFEIEKKEKEGRGKIFQNMASDSIKSHFKMLDAQNKLPPDCVKRVSRVG